MRAAGPRQGAALALLGRGGAGSPFSGARRAAHRPALPVAPLPAPYPRVFPWRTGRSGTPPHPLGPRPAGPSPGQAPAGGPGARSASRGERVTPGPAGGRRLPGSTGRPSAPSPPSAAAPATYRERRRLPPSCATRKPRRRRVTRPPGEGGVAAAGTGAGGGGESPQRHLGTRQPEGPRRRCGVSGRGCARSYGGAWGCRRPYRLGAGAATAGGVPGGGTTFPSEPRAQPATLARVGGSRAGTSFPPSLQRAGSGCVTFPRWRAAERRRGARWWAVAALGARGGGRDGRDRA